MPENGETLKYRVERLEETTNKVDSKVEVYNQRIESKIDKIMNNHLPHIQDKVNEIEIKMADNNAKLGVALTVIFSIIQIAVNKLL